MAYDDSDALWCGGANLGCRDADVLDLGVNLQSPSRRSSSGLRQKQAFLLVYRYSSTL